ncbi:hypothetical protein N7520_004240 [Penicillium odoratum]|uniref:uncharacterized protein n=1 Tax=Penicillium odoratum TaxID=1167516 RepID=UPI00254677C6|nr:uncharacterized protein N7520_004240 [Penicillium odoratum]KAJ5769681.1 hypothetical protein N7520_004240 [Penicillium odoratum]
MHVKNLFAAFTLAGMAAAYPAEDFESTSDLEERGATCPKGQSWCCKQVLGGLAQGYYSSNGGKCTKGTSFRMLYAWPMGRTF